MLDKNGWLETGDMDEWFDTSDTTRFDLSMTVAFSAGYIIGDRNTNKLPWHYPNDLKRFKELTMGKAVVMGVNTHNSIGKLLEGRKNIVLSKKVSIRSVFKPKFEGVISCHNPHEILQLSQREPVVIIGGVSMYELFEPFAHTIYCTRIHGIYHGNLRYHPNWNIEHIENHPADDLHEYPYSFETYSGLGCQSIYHARPETQYEFREYVRKYKRYKLLQEYAASISQK